MQVDVADRHGEHDRRREAFDRGTAGLRSHERVDAVEGHRAALFLVLLGARDAERLAHVLLVHTPGRGIRRPVVPFDYERLDAAELVDPRVVIDKPERACNAGPVLLVEDHGRVSRDLGFQDVRRGEPVMHALPLAVDAGEHDFGLHPVQRGLARCEIVAER